MDKLDVKGLSCPIPVMKTKKVLDKGVKELEIQGTSGTSRENVSRYAASQGFKVETASDADGEWTLIITKE